MANYTNHRKPKIKKIPVYLEVNEDDYIKLSRHSNRLGITKTRMFVDGAKALARVRSKALGFDFDGRM